ncbi:hypothetical protein TIFTF001_028821 [Ficus carica]|uniref:Uncharacterized protein n=1 Tax=Ficus carica TaxID=3494 RepID=A0AA88J0K5_FICCA|nr:hypothetical protein TIFTF001_028821 [Ficus carica]
MKSTCIKYYGVVVELWHRLWVRRGASDPEVQSPHSSRHQLSCDGGCVWRGASIGTNLTCLGGGLSFCGGSAQIWLPFDG